MAKWFDRAATGGDVFMDALEAAEPLREKYPCLHEVMAGIPPKGDKEGQNPASIRIFTNGGFLKVSIAGEGWKNVAYVDIGKDVPTLAVIESAIARGAIGWGRNTERKPSY